MCVQAAAALQATLKEEKKRKREAMKQVLDMKEHAAGNLADPSLPTLAAKVVTFCS